jgi:ABC-type bacteriocin/lantibiotic exporter with double-glycine peptidase domain
MAISTIRLIPSFNSITKSLSSMKYNEAAMLNVYSIFNNKSENDQKLSNNLDEKSNKRFTEKVSFEKNIELKNVSFRYKNNQKTILQNINLKIKKNSKIAIVGKSGSGKTTIVDIIIGLLEPSEGELLIDDFLLSSQADKLNNWKKRIGYIPQNFYLFDDSIKKNVAFGIDEEKIDIDKVKKALQFAQIKDFVDTLENNIETKVGNQGIMLSGGQKQRIIIARAVYNDPDVLILDEATSAIDEEVEKEFINNLIKIGKNKTIIIISHRNSTIENCEIILKVENGKIVNINEKKN